MDEQDEQDKNTCKSMLKHEQNYEQS